MIRIPPDIFPKIPGAYLVGGSIRDLLLGRSPLDWDIAVLKEPDSYAKHIAANISGHLVYLGKSGHPIIRVISKSTTVDVSPLNGQSIEEDLSKRDFTINAMAYELCSGKLIDNAGGQQDLADNIIRQASRNAFVSDPVRLIRAYRMGASLNFVIEPNTASAIERHATLIQKTAAERIREELFKMLNTDRSHPFISQMAHSRILFNIFPELTGLTKLHPTDSRQSNRFEQILIGYCWLENILADPRHHIPKTLQSYLKHPGQPIKVLLKCCRLWQDIGKTVIQPRADHEHPDDSGYELKSATMARRICLRLRFSNRHTDYIQFIIQNHRRLEALFRADQDRSLGPKAVTRFFMECRERAPDLTVLAIAGINSEQEGKSSHGRAFFDFLVHRIPDSYNAFRSKASRPPLLSGHDLIDAFGLTPSPQFKLILDVIEEERLSRDSMTRADALDLVKRYIHHQKR